MRGLLPELDAALAAADAQTLARQDKTHLAFDPSVRP